MLVVAVRILSSTVTWQTVLSVWVKFIGEQRIYQDIKIGCMSKVSINFIININMKGKDFKKEDYVLLAKLAQQTERYEEMLTYADQILQSEQELTPAQRSLCSSAYKNVVSSHRAELKVIQAMKGKTKEEDNFYYTLEKYEGQIKKQLIKICHNLIKLVEQEVIPNKHHNKGAEEIVFFKKIAADFNRYLCEYPEDLKSRKYYIQQSNSNYVEAEQIARSNLPQTNPVRLSLHLNMSVFLWEIKDERERALELANRAFEEAIANIDTVNEQNYKECTMILQLMRDNITLWSGQGQ